MQVTWYRLRIYLALLASLAGEIWVLSVGAAARWCPAAQALLGAAELSFTIASGSDWCASSSVVTCDKRGVSLALQPFALCVCACLRERGREKERERARLQR